MPQNPKPSKELNPNWSQLLSKLKSNGPSPTPHHDTSKVGFCKSSGSQLGKRKERDESLLAAANPHQPNVLAPTSSDFSATKEVAMDCEMVGVSPEGNKSALGRITLVNRWGNILYDEFVRPAERVVDFRTKVSGIRPRDLRKAKDFNTVQKEVAELIKGRVLVGHALRNDLRALLLSHPKKDIRDTSEFQPFLNGSKKKALRHLANEFLGVVIQSGEHCPVEDARVAMLLYQRNKREWEKSVKDTMKHKVKQKKRKQKKNSSVEAGAGQEDGIVAS